MIKGTPLEGARIYMAGTASMFKDMREGSNFDILGMPLHWMILAMSVIILLAVGSDYNLLLVSRFEEESTPGSTPASSGRWPAPARWSPPQASYSPSP